MQMVKWYKVKEDKSEIPKDTILLVSDGKEVSLATFDWLRDSCWRFLEELVETDMVITHWMELPEAPNEY